MPNTVPYIIILYKNNSPEIDFLFLNIIIKLLNAHCLIRLKKLQVDVTSSEREQTKRIVYSVMYGAGNDTKKGVFNSLNLLDTLILQTVSHIHN